VAQFRKSKKVGPFRFTLTHRGISTSAGVGPVRVSRGSDGKYRRTIRAPGGIGLYDTKVIGAAGKGSKAQRAAARRARWEPPASGWDAPVWRSKWLGAFVIVAFGAWVTEMVLAFWIWR